MIDSRTGKIYEVNPRFAAIAGRTREEMAAIDWMSITHPDDVQEDLDGMAALNAGTIRGFSMQKRYQHPDGSYVWINMTIAPLTVEDKARPRHLCMIEDIGERIRAEAAIKERNAQLETANAQIRRHSGLLAAIHKAQTQFITAENISDAFDDLLQSLLALTGSTYGFIDEMNYPPDGPPYLTALAITNIAWNEETRALYPKFLTGELRFTNLNSLFGTVMTSGAPVIANDASQDPRRGGVPPGHPALRAFLGLPLHSGADFVGVLGLANAPGGYSDQTVQYLEPLVKACANIIQAWRNDRRRRQAEESLRLLNAELEQRGAELEAANKELEAFSYSVSHDLRAPLRAIDGFSRILLKEYAAAMVPEARDYLQDIRANTQQMGHLVDDLLAFSRLSRQSLKRERVSPAKLVRQCLEELGREHEGWQVEVRTGELPDCTADPALLKQVWMNLLANAVKYSSRRARATIEVGSLPDAGSGEQTYFVKDNGVGFDMRYAHKLFGVFQRLHRAEDYEGTGVGLAIVQRIVHRHGGRVWADAQPDRGATFFFTLGSGGSNHD